jgi:hypothetical protein
VLATHVALPFATPGQVLPTAPQFSGSLVVPMHAVPFEPKPTLHVKPQVLPVQVAAPLATPGHTSPTDPQFSGSPLVSMQAAPFDP